VDKTSVFTWERNAANPQVRYMPAIIEFLGYNPLPDANTLAERLVHQRSTLGFSQKDVAQRLGVDASTLAQREQGKKEPTGAVLRQVEAFLTGGEVSRARRAG
jgi:DNA-binding XRE family transcriptional regulator